MSSCLPEIYQNQDAVQDVEDELFILCFVHFWEEGGACLTDSVLIFKTGSLRGQQQSPWHMTVMDSFFQGW